MPIVHNCYTPTAEDRAQPGFKAHVEHDRPYYAPGKDGPYTHLGWMQGPFVTYSYESHVGLCLREIEHNGYHDSDFYMLVWNPVKEAPEQILFGTTRAGCGHAMGSHPDATPEVKAAYAAWQARQDVLARERARRNRVCSLWTLRNACRDLGRAHGFNGSRLFKLRNAMRADDHAAVIKLLGAKLRSAFKIKLRDQTVAWLRDPAPRFKTPLSAKQMQYI